ncbi:MAG: DUF3829 domain-containing protein, partial [Deltaproteobacteria bacterium]|nr:DUF3829 domain-containing protein [Deltaproteobacteria bacterium]
LRPGGTAGFETGGRKKATAHQPQRNDGQDRGISAAAGGNGRGRQRSYTDGLSFRDEKAALLARADSLEQQLEASEKRVVELKSERDRLADELKDSTRERDELRKRLGKLDPKAVEPTSSKSKGPQLIVGAAASLAIAAGAVVALTTSSSEPEETAAVAVAPASQGPAEAADPSVPPSAEPTRGSRILAISTHFEHLDHDLYVRSKQLPPPIASAGHLRLFSSWLKPIELNRRLDALQELAKKEPANSELGGKLATYVEAYRKLLPTLDEAERYYRHKDYVEDSNRQGNELEPDLKAGFTRLLTLSEALAPLVRAQLEAELAGSPGGDELIKHLDRTWLSCSTIIYDLRADRDPSASLGECSKQQRALEDHVEKHELRGQEYMVSLFDKMVQYGKAARRRERAHSKLGAIHNLAQVHAYAAKQYRQRRTL